MFLLISGRHVGAHLDEHHHGVSIQISINLGKIFPRISRLRKIAVTWISVRVYAYSSSFYSQILDFIYWTVLIFILIWRATENQLAISFICNGINMIINIILLMLAFEQAFSIFPAKLLASVKIEIWESSGAHGLLEDGWWLFMSSYTEYPFAVPVGLSADRQLHGCAGAVFLASLWRTFDGGCHLPSPIWT